MSDLNAPELSHAVRAQNQNSKIKTPKSKATSTGRGSMGLKGQKWTYTGFEQNDRNTKRSGIIQTSGLKWSSILTIKVWNGLPEGSYVNNGNGKRVQLDQPTILDRFGFSYPKGSGVRPLVVGGIQEICQRAHTATWLSEELRACCASRMRQLLRVLWTLLVLLDLWRLCNLCVRSSATLSEGKLLGEGTEQHLTVTLAL